MCRTVSTSIPNRNLLAQRSEGEAAHESLFAYAVRRKHLAEEFVDLIGGLWTTIGCPFLLSWTFPFQSRLCLPAQPRLFAIVSSRDQSRTY